MKKLNILWLPMLLLALVASCDDSDKFVEPVPTLELVSSNVIFDAENNQGTIVVNNTGSGAITATSSESWCTVSVAGNTVNVNVSKHENYEGRTAVVTIKNNVDEIHVPVTQQGAIWALENVDDFVFTDESSSVELLLKSNFDQTITVPSWITYTLNGTRLTLTAQENNTGRPRVGTVSVVSDKRGRYDFQVAQYGPRDIAGTYEATFTKFTGEVDEDGNRVVDDDGVPVKGKFTTTFTIERDQTDTLLFKAVGLSSHPDIVIPFNYNMDTQTLSVKNAQRLYNDTKLGYYFYTFVTTENNMLVNTASYTYGAPYTLDEETNMPLFEFQGADITVSSQATTINGFDVYVMSRASTVISTYGLGYWDMFQYLVFKRID